MGDTPLSNVKHLKLDAGPPPLPPTPTGGFTISVPPPPEQMPLVARTPPIVPVTLGPDEKSVSLWVAGQEVPDWLAVLFLSSTSATAFYWMYIVLHWWFVG
jgi:hypothetical protein